MIAGLERIKAGMCWERKLLTNPEEKGNEPFHYNSV
jgi:hypothetical protein